MNTSAAPIRLGVGCAILLAAGFTVTARAQADEYIRSYTVSGRPSVHVDSDNGVIRVTTSEGAKVEFSVKYDKSDWESAGGKGPFIDSRQSGDSVELTAYIHSQDWSDWNPLNSHEKRLSIEVRMPRNADLQLQAHNGVIDVSSVNGAVTIKTHNGGVSVAQISGTLQIDSHNGAINLHGVKGSMKVGTHNGRITGSGLDGRCSMVAHNGAVDVRGRFDLLDVSSHNGSVDASAEPGSKMASAWSLETSNSWIDLAIPSDLKATLDAGAPHSVVTLELPVTLQGDSAESGGTQVRRALNGGGPELRLRTTTGTIRVHKV